ncbi:MAG: hypothetical protein OEW64_14230 [Gammaproteobacteria bacterium]|nr:hypothetical protein [Gammaproteobacteria bacterium]MDH5305240.1 hypothetical protein [Gammaproteobacteria bacterium]MDH5323277.1 hypothetical protein [Gammaproteobacteria bacterium]
MNNRPGKVAAIIMCLAMLANTACTSMQSIHASEEAITEMKIRPGDKVTLNYTNGNVEEVKLVSFDETGISGIAKDGRTVAVDYAHLVSMDHKEVEVLKTVGASLGGLVLGAAVVGGVAIGAAAAVAGGM